MIRQRPVEGSDSFVRKGPLAIQPPRSARTRSSGGFDREGEVFSRGAGRVQGLGAHTGALSLLGRLVPILGLGEVTSEILGTRIECVLLGHIGNAPVHIAALTPEQLRANGLARQSVTKREPVVGFLDDELRAYQLLDGFKERRLLHTRDPLEEQELETPAADCRQHHDQVAAELERGGLLLVDLREAEERVQRGARSALAVERCSSCATRMSPTCTAALSLGRRRPPDFDPMLDDDGNASRSSRAPVHRSCVYTRMYSGQSRGYKRAAW
jgi:hypothetical protein